MIEGPWEPDFFGWTSASASKASEWTSFSLCITSSSCVCSKGTWRCLCLCIVVFSALARSRAITTLAASSRTLNNFRSFVMVPGWGVMNLSLSPDSRDDNLGDIVLRLRLAPPSASASKKPPLSNFQACLLAPKRMLAVAIACFWPGSHNSTVIVWVSEGMQRFRTPVDSQMPSHVTSPLLTEFGFAFHISLCKGSHSDLACSAPT
mmetsp:Transcript_4596/g.10804  ORF Transcript_4596/g.10804 Transcript_4596/m.10804 type:complete len:206 (+) Transcript_4596:1693-2310(+)